MNAIIMRGHTLDGVSYVDGVRYGNETITLRAVTYGPRSDKIVPMPGIEIRGGGLCVVVDADEFVRVAKSLWELVKP